MSLLRIMRISQFFGVLALIACSNCFAQNELMESIRAARIADVVVSTRSELKADRSARLNRNIRGLITGEAIVLDNIGMLLREGQRLMSSKIEQDRDYAREQIAMQRLEGIDNPARLSFTNIYPVQVFARHTWMDFSEQRPSKIDEDPIQVTYTDFANTVLGGGWDAGGIAQEENAVRQCPEFALLLSKEVRGYFDSDGYLTRKGSSDEVEIRLSGNNTADPLLLKNLRFIQRLKSPYRENVHRHRSEKFDDWSKVAEFVSNAPAVNMIAMAAPEVYFDDRGFSYSSIMLQDLFNNSFTAQALVRRNDNRQGRSSYLITGGWGSGAFGHNLQVSLCIQYLAARLSGVEFLEFTGVTNEQLSVSVGVVDQVLASYQNSVEIKGSEVLQDLQRVFNDLRWTTSPL